MDYLANSILNLVLKIQPYAWIFILIFGAVGAICLLWPSKESKTKAKEILGWGCVGAALLFSVVYLAKDFAAAFGF